MYVCVGGGGGRSCINPGTGYKECCLESETLTLSKQTPRHSKSKLYPLKSTACLTQTLESSKIVTPYFNIFGWTEPCDKHRFLPVWLLLNLNANQVPVLILMIVKSYPILSYPILSHPILSYPIQLHVPLYIVVVIIFILNLFSF